MQIVDTLAELVIRGICDVYTILNAVSLKQPAGCGRGMCAETRKSCFIKVFVKIAEATSPETVRLLWEDPSCGFALKMQQDSKVGALSKMQICRCTAYFVCWVRSVGLSEPRLTTQRLAS